MHMSKTCSVAFHTGYLKAKIILEARVLNKWISFSSRVAVFFAHHFVLEGHETISAKLSVFAISAACSPVKVSYLFSCKNVSLVGVYKITCRKRFDKCLLNVMANLKKSAFKKSISQREFSFRWNICFSTRLFFPIIYQQVWLVKRKADELPQDV